MFDSASGSSHLDSASAYGTISTPRQLATRPLPSQTIPVVSLQSFLKGNRNERAKFVQTVGDALMDIGFFALEDHGIDQSVIRRAYEVAEAFFNLPLETRLKYEVPELCGQRGYTSFGREHAKDHAAPDLKEFWHVGRERDGDPRTAALPWHNLWPNELPEMQQRFVTLFRQLDTCAAQLLTACSLYLDMPGNWLPEMATCGDSILRVIHYPPVPENRHPEAVRAAAHEDINLITLLCEATAGGLELLQRDGNWRPIHALDGQVVVDAGDMLQYLTHGLFRSTTHRVVNPDNSRERRFSMPFFVHPRPEVDLTPNFPRARGLSGNFAPITAGEYLRRRLQEIGLLA